MISEILRKAIDACGLSVNELARQSEIPQPMLTRFINGKDIRLNTAEKLARFFGLILVSDNEVRTKSSGLKSATKAAKRKPSRKKQV